MRGVLVKKVAPVYPPLARQARIQGTVILKVSINKSGDVYDVQLVSGHPMLAPAAIEAVKQWKYQPYLLNGQPVEVDTNVQVTFKISDKPASTGAEVPSGVAGDAPPSGPAPTPQRIPLTPDEAGPPRVVAPERIRVSSGVAQGFLVSEVDPEYPPDAREQSVQGVVLLKVNIDKEGNVYRVELISGHPLLAPAAIDAVKQWKYKPYLLNGTPVEVETQVQVNFTLTPP
jgi:TonB family protein